MANDCYSLQEVFGGNAVSDEYHIGRHVANLFVTQTYEGQSDIHGELALSICYRAHILIQSTSSDTWTSHYWHPSFRLRDWTVLNVFASVACIKEGL